MNVTKYYCRKCKNCSKPNFVIDTGPIHIRNCCLGSVTGLAWHGWSRYWCDRGPRFDGGGEPSNPF